LMKKVFENDSLVITMDTSNKDVEEWDSLNYTAIISAIEKDFNIKFKMREFLEFKNVGDIVRTVGSKI
ncbi:MAG: acyl carrier protein, partial [Bacteroidetes bacterium]|nr:acyl carrier protein [Bacteroidota bacterium]